MKEQILEFIGEGSILIYIAIGTYVLSLFINIYKSHHNAKKN